MANGHTFRGSNSGVFIFDMWKIKFYPKLLIAQSKFSDSSSLRYFIYSEISVVLDNKN